eukprot:m.218693 g.218693  ORF g.218693 m.218693 type:complete len:202 (+) comp15905_c1_seq5:1217-1822(+)
MASRPKPISSARDRPVSKSAFATPSSKDSAFVAAYARRDLPCRLMHGSVKHKLEWTQPPEQIPYDQLLPVFAQGLVETKHPYYFVARQGFHDLLAVPGAKEKATPLISELVGPLRSTLMSPNAEVYQCGLEAISQLSNVVGPAMTPHLKQLIGQLSRNASKPKFRDAITTTLNTLEVNGGDDCYKLIKAKIPTYCTANIGR